MEEIVRQVRRARWRLGIQRFAGVLGWCWFATLAVAAVMIVLGKFYPLGVADWMWAVAALVVGLAASGVWMALTRRGPLGAAIEIDRRYGLKERVSSTLSLDQQQRRTPLGEALVSDAVRRIERIDVGEHFRVVPSRWVLLPLLPGLAALLVAVFVEASTEKTAQAKPETPAVAKQVKRSSESLRRRLAERRREAEKMGLKDAERLFKRLEQGARQMTKTDSRRPEAMVKLNDLARQLAERHKQLGGAEKIKNRLDQLNKINQGPADKFAQAVSKGDFQKAIDELKKIGKQLQDSKLSDEQKKALANQLDQMKDKLNKLADAHQAAVGDLKQRANQARQAGQDDEADKLNQQIEKLLQQAPQMQQLQDLAKKMGQCAKCLKQGQAQGAAQALNQLQGNLQNMQQQLQEMEMLDDAMAQLGQARNQMACPQCKGVGCALCQGLGQGENPNGKPGMGMGRGQGLGARPEAETETKMYDSQVRQKVGQGVGVVTDLVDGPNVRGNAEAAIQQQVDSAREGSTDPLSGRRLPKRYGEHAREYLDHFREGD